MNLTVEDMARAIQSARRLEDLQAELRDALIQRLIEKSSTPATANPALPGAPLQ